MSWTLLDDAGQVLEAGDDETRTVTTPAGTRPYTAEENARADAVLARDAAEQAAGALRAKAVAALAANAAFLALSSPTNAQTLAQVKALTRQVNALARLAADALDDTTDT